MSLFLILMVKIELTNVFAFNAKLFKISSSHTYCFVLLVHRTNPINQNTFNINMDFELLWFVKTELNSNNLPHLTLSHLLLEMFQTQCIKIYELVLKMQNRWEKVTLNFYSFQQERRRRNVGKCRHHVASSGTTFLFF